MGKQHVQPVDTEVLDRSLRLYSRADLVRLWGISETTIKEAFRSGRLRWTHEFGRSKRVCYEEITRFLAMQRI